MYSNGHDPGSHNFCVLLTHCPEFHWEKNATFKPYLPISQQHKQHIQSHHLYCKSEWPKCCNDPKLKPYWSVRATSLSWWALLHCRGSSRIVVPKQLQKQIPQKIHTCHQHIFTILRAVIYSWWPDISSLYSTRSWNLQEPLMAYSLNLSLGRG